MKELEFIEIIKKTLSKNSYIGDDCAYLKELGIVITQDNFIEDIHFCREFSTPYQIAYKAIIINLSDVYASGAIPKYLTVSISMPNTVDEKFVSEFYEACEDLSKEFDIEIIGGDITGANKLFISICAIGLTKGRNISSRKNAKAGDYVITTGVHGSSAAGLWLLQHGEQEAGNRKQNQFILNHLMPTVQKDFSNEIATNVNGNYAMMDTSDGLIDALFKIAQASDALISIDFDKIPYDREIEIVATQANINFKDWIFYGGEDYKLVACVDEKNLKNISNYSIIGRVKEKPIYEEHFVEIFFDDNHIEKITDLEQTYNHFRG